MKELFEVNELTPVNLGDKRGPTYNWTLPDGRSIVLFFRKKGSILGNHYHKGEDPSKNPERFFLAMGKLKGKFRGPDGKEKEKTLEVKFGEQALELTIYPFAWHSFEVLEDTLLVESRITPFDPDKPDVYS